jgi:hypothetical protein
MRATVTRLPDTARLSLRAGEAGLWEVVRALPSGMQADPDLAMLIGQRVVAERVLPWASGLLPSVALCAAGA